MSSSIRIKEINVRKLGPVDRFSLKAEDLNLVYGKNESGKTFLVEFIISCLFGKNWDLREISPEGKIIIEGADKKGTAFTPSSPESLNDYLQEGLPGLPAEIDKLMIIKGAHSEISTKEISADNHMEVLKAYLSGKKILSEIDGKIGKTLRKAVIEENAINIPGGLGIVKSRENAAEKLQQIDKLKEDLNSRYSLGPLVDCKRYIEKLEKEKKQHEESRRRYAFKLSSTIEQLRKRLQDMPGEEHLKKLSLEVSARKNLKREASEKRVEIKYKEEQIKYLPWLEEARETYESIISDGASPGFYRGLIITLIAASALLVFIYPPAALAAMLASAAAVLLMKPRSISSDREVDNIKDTYREHFAEELKDFSTIKSKISQLTEISHKLEAVRENLLNIEDRITDAGSKIEKWLLDITKPLPDEKDWEETIKQQENTRKETEKKINQCSSELASLKVKEEDFIKSEEPSDYDEKKEEKTIEELQKQQEILQKLREPLDDIRTRIVRITGSDAVDDEKLIDSLLQTRRIVQQEYRQTTAGIIGTACLASVIDEMSGREEEKVRMALENQELKEPVEKFTAKYKSFKLKENKLYLSDGYAEYGLDEVSDGAREQIFLGLRIGMAARLLGKNRMFFILDDAFQYSDWKRREKMVDRAVALSESGWQVFYFTMDDHIRDLFKKYAAKSSCGFSLSEIG